MTCFKVERRADSNRRPPLGTGANPTSGFEPLTTSFPVNRWSMPDAKFAVAFVHGRHPA